jgi:hypothetical protein
LLTDRARSDEGDTWPDLDVAFLGDLTLVKAAAERTALCRAVHQNTFGGLKLQLTNGEVVDVWSWPHPGDSSVTAAHWEALLGRVDFGVNAVAYIGASGQIIVHPRWLEDVSKGRVEVLAASAPERGIQAVRSVALMTKLRDVYGRSFELGAYAAKELEYFAVSALEGEIVATLAYVKKKTGSGRWSSTVESEFLRLCREIGLSEAFLRIMEREQVSK